MPCCGFDGVDLDKDFGLHFVNWCHMGGGNLDVAGPAFDIAGLVITIIVA